MTKPTPIDDIIAVCNDMGIEPKIKNPVYKEVAGAVELYDGNRLVAVMRKEAFDAMQATR